LMLLKLRKHEIHGAKDAYSIGKIVCIHIDYANRPESAAEADFVKDWCESNALVYNGGGSEKIVFRKKVIDEVRRGITDRSNYEKVSREIRYNFYKEILREFESEFPLTEQFCGIIFGHHKGDVQENIISNMMKGISPLELAGMSESTVASGVTIWRPLLQHPKTDIYDFAHQWGIPYLKDSTPSWSTRGKIRRQLMPLLAEIYGDGYLNGLSRVAQASEDARTLITSNVYNPFLQSIRRFKCGVCVNVIPFVDQPISFWKEMLKEVMHSMGMCMVRDAAVKNFVDRINRFSVSNHNHGKREGWLELRKGFFTYLESNGDLIVFLHGLLKGTPSCQSDLNRSTYYIILNPFDFADLADNNTKENICFELDELKTELFISGWQISIDVNQKAESSNIKFEEDFIKSLLQGKFQYRVNYLIRKKLLIGLIYGNKMSNYPSNFYKYDDNADCRECERKIISGGKWTGNAYSIQYPSAFKNVNAKLKHGLPLLNFIEFLGDNISEADPSGKSDKNGDEMGTAEFKFRFVGVNRSN